MTRAARVLGIAALLLAATAIPAAADPVSGAIAAIATFFATASTATLIAIGTAVLTVGLTYVELATVKKPDSAITSYQTLQTGGVVPQSFVFGTWSTAGSLCYFNYWGLDGKTPNAHETRVIALSDLPVNALTSVIVDGNACTYGWGPETDLGYVIPEYVNADGNPRLWVKFYDGTQTEADAFLVAKFSADPNRPYSDKRVGTGRAYAVVTLMAAPKLSLSNLSTIQFIVEGVKFYDPRTDTSVGGDGAQRFDDPSTWTFNSDNPQLVRYNLRRGIGYGGKWFYGPQNMNAARVPFDNWSAAMNGCDLLVDNESGGQEKQYRCGGEVAVSTQPADLDESLMKACNARHIETGCVYKTTTGVIGTPVRSYNDDSFLISEPKTFDQYRGLDNTVNGITGHFPDPAQGYKSVDAPGRFNSDFQAQDGNNERISDINYDAVPYAEQVQRLMQSALLEARRSRVHTVVLPHTEWQNEPGDAWIWNSTKNGYIDKVFRVESQKLLPNRDIQATIREADPSDYDWEPDTDFIPVSAGLLSANPVPSQPMDGWDVLGTIIVGDDGRQRPGVLFNWGTSDIEDVKAVLFDVRRASDGSAIYSGECFNFGAGTFSTSENMLPNTNYEGRGRFLPGGDRDTDWSDWLPFTTPNILIGAIDLYDDAISRAKLDASMRSLNDFVGASSRQLLDKLAQVSQSVAETGFGASTDMQVIRQQIGSVYGNVTAEYTSAIVVATGPGSAIVQQIEELNASIEGFASADAVDALTTRVSTNEDGIEVLVSDYESLSASLDGKADSSAVTTLSATVSSQGADIDANSDALTSLNSTVGLFSASGLFRVDTHAALNGAEATVAISAAATGGGASATAAMYISAKSGASEILFVADKFLITDGTNLDSPFLFDGTSLFVKSAVIPTITSDKLEVGVINASTLIASNVIVTGHLQADTVTSWDALSTPSSGITTSALNPWGSGATVSVSVDSSTKVLLQFAGSFTRAGGTSPVCKFRIYRVGSPDALLEESVVGGSGVPQCCPFVVTAVDETPLSNAGNGHYYAIGIIDSGTTSPASYNNGTLTAMAGKR